MCATASDTAEIRGSTYRVTVVRVGGQVRVGAERLVSQFNGRDEWARLRTVPAGLSSLAAQLAAQVNK